MLTLSIPTRDGIKVYEYYDLRSQRPGEPAKEAEPTRPATGGEIDMDAQDEEDQWRWRWRVIDKEKNKSERLRLMSEYARDRHCIG